MVAQQPEQTKHRIRIGGGVGHEFHQLQLGFLFEEKGEQHQADAPPVALAPGEVLVRIKAICDEFECYGYRRVGAALRHQGAVVNSKKLRRLMKAHNLQPKQRRRYVLTTDSEHGGPIFPDLAKDVVLEHLNSSG